MGRVAPHGNPRTTSTAATSRQGALLPQDILPSRVPFVLTCLTLVATGAGLWGAHVAAPVGNLVHLDVHLGAPHPLGPPVLAATQAELIRQFRALKLDVGGPEDGRAPAMLVDVTVWAGPDPDVQDAVTAVGELRVTVTDDAAGGESTAHTVGFAPTQVLAAHQAGVQLADLMTEQFAAAVAPSTGHGSTLRRMTDGRGSLRVYARLVNQLHEGRQERLRAMATPPPQPGVTPLSVPGQHSRLVGLLQGGKDAWVYLAVTPRTEVLLPTARLDPLLIDGAEEVERALPLDADSVALLPVGGWAGEVEAWAMDGRDGWHPEQDEKLYGLPVVEGRRVFRWVYAWGHQIAWQQEIAWQQADGTFHGVRMHRCGQMSTYSWEGPDDVLPYRLVPWGYVKTLTKEGVRPQDEAPLDASWPRHTVSHTQLKDGTRLALAPFGVPERQRLLVRWPGEWTFKPLLYGASADVAFDVANDEDVVVVESADEDPDLNASWHRVSRVALSQAH